jgi:hypothetical protein
MAEHLFTSAYIPCFSETYSVDYLGLRCAAVKALRDAALRKLSPRRHVEGATAAMIPCGGVFGLVMILWLN